MYVQSGSIIMPGSRRIWCKVNMDETTSPRPVSKGVKIYQFKIRLLETEPEVWRRVEIPGDFTVAQFQKAVMMSIGWIPGHWSVFTGPDGESIEDPAEKHSGLKTGKKGKSQEKDATKIRVCELYDMEKKMSMLRVGAECWLHEIELEGIKDLAGRKHYPKCTDGENACPPEECGGSEGYVELMKALADPKHADHEEMKEWLVSQGYEKFDPTKFKPKDVDFCDVYYDDSSD
jgi:hypothetical protein